MRPGHVEHEPEAIRSDDIRALCAELPPQAPGGPYFAAGRPQDVGAHALAATPRALARGPDVSDVDGRRLDAG